MANNVKNRKKKNSEAVQQAPKRYKRNNLNNSIVEEECASLSQDNFGKVKKISLRNFMCHDAMEITLNENINFIVGCNGSGKSAILTALTIGLGARANVTSRGTSIKEFIKKGESSAIIEVTLINKGDISYKHDIYGDFITITRYFNFNTSTYKIKDSKDLIISTKREELDNIIVAMNIQIDNPISILNQDVSRTFLVASKPEEKYNLFLKATLLDIIENNYIDALKICEEEYKKLERYTETLTQIKLEIERLKDNIHRMEEIDESRVKLNNLEMELQWAMAIAEEARLHKIQETLDTHKSNLEELQNIEQSVGTKDAEIDTKINVLEQKIQQIEKEIIDSNEAYNSAKQKYMAAYEVQNNKQREWRTAQNIVKRLEDDIQLLKKEIQKLENSNSQEYNKRKGMKEKLSKQEEKLEEYEATLRTKQTELMHLEADKVRLMQEVQSAKIEKENSDSRLHKIKKDLSAFEQQSDNALSLYGPNIPRLLRRIDEEYKKGRFKEKPLGPIGAYIKLKDAAWAPAVENHLGVNLLNTFCVDNSQDSKLLSSIMKEIFHNERFPQIITSKFFNKVHDVSKYCTQSPKYSNLLEAVVIENPVVCNCLIDQREIECVLLIPTNKEACEIMSNATRVPRNCKKAFTQQGDLFFPDPHYKSYGGRRDMRAKYLQVSTMEVIQTLKDELQQEECKRQELSMTYKTICEKIQRTNTELNNVSTAVSRLKVIQRQCKESIDNLKDNIESSEATSSDLFRNEAAELEKKMAQEKVTESLLCENVKELQKNVESLQVEVKRNRDLKHNLDMTIDPLKDQIKELKQEKIKYRDNSHRATRKQKEIRQALQGAMAKFEIQERATKKAVSDATKNCPRINTTRSESEVKNLSKQLRNKINEVEHQFGSIDDLRQRLREREDKYGVNIDFMSHLKESCVKHIERVKHRQKMFIELRRLYGIHVQKSFTDVLALRQYKGTIKIDHDNKVLDLYVSAREDKNASHDPRTLSGGERSYSTVAFILALWECVHQPFYFLDEFDVFMDKVNRRVIMDILLDHAKSHPESQFVFLTPLETTHILPENYITIHQLQPPERKSLTQ